VKRAALLLALAVPIVGACVWLLLDEPSLVPPAGGSRAEIGLKAQEDIPSLRGATTPAKAASGGRIEGRVRVGDTPTVASITLRARPALDSWKKQTTEEMLRDPTEVLDSPPRATTTSDVGGRFSFADLARGEWRVDASSPEGLTGDVVVDVRADGAVVSAYIGLEARIHELRGLALQADGRPWRGVILAGGVTPVRTDAEGRFRIGRLAPGEVSLSALDPGRFLLSGLTARVPSDTEIVFVVDEGVRLMTGRVVASEDGRALAGAQVEATSWLEGDLQVLAQAMSASDGSFGIPVDVKDGARISVSAAGRCTVSRRVEAEDQDIRLALPRAARLRGVVRSPEGAPAVGALVRVGQSTSLAGSAYLSLPVGSVASDDRGAFEIAVPPGEQRAWVFGPGWISEDLGHVLEVGAFPSRVLGADGTVELRAVPAPWADGRVLDAEGRPVEGAVIEAEPSDVPHEWRHLAGAFVPASTSSGPDGRFRLEPLLPGRVYEFTVEAPGVARRHVRGVRAPSTGALAVELRLFPARSLKVLVRDASTDAPVGGASVSTTWGMNGAASPTGGWALTDARGLAMLDGLPGEDGQFGVTVEADGYAPDQLSPAVDDAEITFQLAPSPSLSVAGRVVFGDGGPDNPAALAGVRIEGRRRLTTTQPGGAFRLSGLHDDEVRLSARRSWRGITFRGDVEAQGGDQSVVLTLVREETTRHTPLRVRVVDPGGRPVPWASLAWPGWGDAVYTVSEGTALVWHPGSSQSNAATLWVFGARGAEGRPLPLGSVEDVLVAPEAREVEVRLPPEQSISGRTVGPRGEGVAAVQVRAARSWDSYRVTATATVTTDARGAFRLGGLGGGTYVLVFDVPPGYGPVEAVAAQAGSEDLKVSLRSAVRAVVRLVGPDGAPVEGARVRLTLESEPNAPVVKDSGPWREPPKTDASGTVALTGLDPARRYVLWVEAPSLASEAAIDDPDAEALSTRYLLYVHRSWKPADVEIRLDPARVVRGRVVDRRGRLVPGAWVYGRVGDGPWESVITRTGRFELPQLPPGTVTLRGVSRTLDGRDLVSEDLVASGQSGMVLTIDTGPELSVRIRDWTPDKRVRAHLLLVVPGREPTLAHDSVDADGRVRFAGLSADATYALWIPSREDGRCLLARDLRPSPDELILQLDQGRAVTGVVANGPKPEDLHVEAVELNTGLKFRVEPTLTAQFETPTLPEGRWVIRGTGRSGDKRWAGEVVSPPGSNVVLTLREVP
jgi:hypothetical protein